MKKINFVITAFFILISTLLNAQSHNEEVTIEGSYNPHIQKSERLATTPDIPKRDFKIPSYEINTEDFTYKYRADLEPISPLSYTQNKGVDICNNFIKAGFGTRISPDFLFRHYSSVSKRMSLGVKRKLAVVTAFMNDPDILILDEPTVGLDPKQVIEIRELIKSFNKVNGDKRWHEGLLKSDYYRE